MRGRKETDPSSPFYGMWGLDAPDQKVVEGRREGSGVEVPEGSLGQVVMKGGVHGGGVGFLEEHQRGLY